MRINNNISALQAYTNLLHSNRKMDKSIERLSSGYRINSVADDAAGLAVSHKLRTQIGGMDMAARNALDGISLIQTADGALNEVHSMLNRIRELAVQAANDTVEPSDREKMQNEVSDLMDEIYDTANRTSFNTIKMLNGEADAETFVDKYGNNLEFKGLKLQIGESKGMTLILTIPDIKKAMDEVAENHFPTPIPGELRSGERVSVEDVPSATATIEFCDDAIASISKIRSRLGAYENRLQHTDSNLRATLVNTQQALSRIMDTDMALEMSYNMQYSIIAQAGMAILGQANQRPQQILQLL